DLVAAAPRLHAEVDAVAALGAEVDDEAPLDLAAVPRPPEAHVQAEAHRDQRLRRAAVAGHEDRLPAPVDALDHVGERAPVVHLRDADEPQALAVRPLPRLPTLIVPVHLAGPRVSLGEP